jgi:hypothetical protein
MRLRLTTVAVLTATAAAISATPAAAERSCGTTHLLQGGSARVTIARGALSCSAARGIVKLYGSSRGTPHGLNGPRSGFYTTYPAGWRCGPLEQGGSACWRGGSVSSVNKARDVVWLELVF